MEQARRKLGAILWRDSVIFGEKFYDGRILSAILLESRSKSSHLGRREAHGNVYFGVANGTACTMHSLAWDDPEDNKDAHNSIRTSTPGQVIDLPKPPDHIIVDIKPIKQIKWPHNLNLSPNSNLIQIPIRINSRCK